MQRTPIFWMAAAFITLSGCFYGPPGRERPIESALPQEGPMPRFTTDEDVRADVPPPYRIQHPDILNLKVRDLEEFNGELEVDREGKIRIPTLEQEILVAGMSVEQAEMRISSLLSPLARGYPEVRIKVQTPQSQYFYAYGAVGKQGRFPMGEQLVNLRDALLSMGMFRAGAASWTTYIITPHPTDPTHVIVDARDLLLGRTRENIQIKPGDIIYVPTSAYSRYNQVLREVLGQVYQGVAIDQLYQYMEHRVNTQGTDAVGGI